MASPRRTIHGAQRVWNGRRRRLRRPITSRKLLSLLRTLTTMELTIAHQFDDLEQQQEAVTLGMWVFLATEVLFFGGLFLGYAVYRGIYHATFGAASRHLDIFWGTTNTAVLLCSSLSMAMGVHAAQLNNRKKLVTFLIITMLLGTVFLGIKGYEYSHKFEKGLIPGPRSN